MKCTESWLREWVNPKLSRDALAHELTMAGLEVEEIIPVKGSKDDAVIDISITPNRGDCLSILGVAREVSAITKEKMVSSKFKAVAAISEKTLKVNNSAATDCPHYFSRVIEDVDLTVATPGWMTTRLEQAGFRVINPVVDVTNYVMIELGQPMHAFDLAKMNGDINIRYARQSEKLQLLDGSEQTLNTSTLVIADNNVPHAIAGVMGSEESGVTSLSKSVVLESAFFSPEVIARQRQYYKLHSESAYRFERGVDPNLQRKAIERATQLILDITGGKPGAVVENTNPLSCLSDEASLASSQEEGVFKRVVKLSKKKLDSLLGINIATEEVTAILQRLAFDVISQNENLWRVAIPGYRFDLTIEEDLIEEVARLYGYDNIPAHYLQATLKVNDDEHNSRLAAIRLALSHQGFHEIISYSFVDKKLQGLLSDESGYELLNPITSEMEVMRTSMLPGLVSAMLYNKSRQMDQIQLFEMGVCFNQIEGELSQKPMLGGLITGPQSAEQWGIAARAVDFYDLKGCIENILSMTSPENFISFKKSANKALHPGQQADIYLKNKKIGSLGALHPGVLLAIDFTKDKQNNVFVFELDINTLLERESEPFKPISKFPEIRRDIAILLNQAVPSQLIRDTIIETAGDWLNNVFIFDVYEGKGVSPGQKSIALAMVFQHPERTLVDDEVTGQVSKVIKALQDNLGAELRS